MLCICAHSCVSECVRVCVRAGDTTPMVTVILVAWQIWKCVYCCGCVCIELNPNWVSPAHTRISNNNNNHIAQIFRIMCVWKCARGCHSTMWECITSNSVALACIAWEKDTKESSYCRLLVRNWVFAIHCLSHWRPRSNWQTRKVDFIIFSWCQFNNNKKQQILEGFLGNILLRIQPNNIVAIVSVRDFCDYWYEIRVEILQCIFLVQTYVSNVIPYRIFTY